MKSFTVVKYKFRGVKCRSNGVKRRSNDVKYENLHTNIYSLPKNILTGLYNSKRLCSFVNGSLYKLVMPGLNELNRIENFSRFFQENQERYLSFAYSYIRNRADAEDIFMESVIALWESRDRWENDTNLQALLLTIVRNKSLNYLSHLQVRSKVEEDITEHSRKELDLRVSSLESCDPDEIFNTEIHSLVNKALNKMPEKSRRIYILSRQHDITNKKIAAQMGLSVRSVEFHITKALKILRQELKDYLISIFL